MSDTGGGAMSFFELDWDAAFGQPHDWTAGCPTGFTVTVDSVPTGISGCQGGYWGDDKYSWFGELDSSAPVGSTVTITWTSDLLVNPPSEGAYELGVWYAQDGHSLPAPSEMWMVLIVDIQGAIASTGEAPVDIIQQVGLPAGGTCDAISEDLNWSGVASGGWSQTWAEWPNEGTGGPVCSRTLHLNVHTGAWGLLGAQQPDGSGFQQDGVSGDRLAPHPDGAELQPKVTIRCRG